MNNLPAEIWLNIFSYLDLEELAMARRVCKFWWEVINTDSLWKPLLLDRGITLDMVNLDSNDGSEQELINCSWANLCLSYYNKLIPNWKNLRYSCSRYPRFTADAVVRMPYIIRTSDPRKLNVVEVLRVVNGDFVVTSRLPLPDDGLEECYEPQMTADNVFAVSKNNATLVFKLVDHVFCFSKALHFTANDSFVSCSDVNGLSKFMSKKEDVVASLSCGLVTASIIWFLDSISMNVYVWNYVKSELLLKWHTSCVTENSLRLRSSDKYVFLTSRDMLTIFSFHGEKLWHYEGSTVYSLSWNKYDCGFIQEMKDGKYRVVCLEIPKLTSTNIYVQDNYPVALTLHKTDRLAYCMNTFSNSMHVFCVSLTTGAILWDKIICKSIQSIGSILKSTLSGFMEMNIVLGRYLTVYGVDGESHDLCSSFINPGMLSLFSAGDGTFICSESFDPYTVLFLEDQLILTGKPNHQGSRKYKYEMYNFQCA